MAPPAIRKPLWDERRRDGVRLSCADFGGSGPTVVLLHGLAGCAEEWFDTASALSGRFRVLVPDQRGHGRCERRPPDVSRQAHVADVVMWLERFDAAPAVLVGQSLGAHTAFLVASRRPELVRALVVVEATPEANPQACDDVMRWLATWPVPFASRLTARRFFGGDTAWAAAWTRGLEERKGAYWPRFDADIMLASLTETSATSYWDEWSRVSCPTLIVRGERGIARIEAERMQELVPRGQMVVLPGAGHDAHLDCPEAWQSALQAFLDDLP